MESGPVVRKPTIRGPLTKRIKLYAKLRRPLCFGRIRRIRGTARIRPSGWGTLQLDVGTMDKRRQVRVHFRIF